MKRTLMTCCPFFSYSLEMGSYSIRLYLNSFAKLRFMWWANTFIYKNTHTEQIYSFIVVATIRPHHRNGTSDEAKIKKYTFGFWSKLVFGGKSPTEKKLSTKVELERKRDEQIIGNFSYKSSIWLLLLYNDDENFIHI